jgi:Tol biopolymer transport system component
MSEQSVEMRFQIIPPIEGDFFWEGNTMKFTPRQAFIPGVTYTILLEAGFETLSGKRTLRNGSWQVLIRDPEIVYLSPKSGSDIWQIPLSGIPKRLTSTNGKVYDFNIAADGNFILYSVFNNDGGLDLYRVRREDYQAELLLDCHSERCTEAVSSPLQGLIAYTRIAPLENGQRTSRIWVFFEESGMTEPLYQDQNIHGSAPCWSPDGRYLAFYDGAAAGIRVVDFDHNHHLYFESNEGRSGSWSVDGDRLLYTGAVQTVMQPFSNIFEINLESGNMKRLFEKIDSQLDFGQPIWTPDGNWITVGLRLVEKSPNKQIYLVSPDGDQSITVTDDQRYAHASYQWSPDGSWLVFQRFQTGTPQETPEVLIWERSTQKTKVLVKDATLPKWMP